MPVRIEDVQMAKSQTSKGGRPKKNGGFDRSCKQRGINGRNVAEHVFIAETVLGRRLPAGALVHHVDGNRWNNAHSNLVICPSQAYHLMLHRRQDSLAATGNPNLFKCHICGQWDKEEALYFRGPRPGQWHRKCSNLKRTERKRAAKQLARELNA